MSENVTQENLVVHEAMPREADPVSRGGGHKWSPTGRRLWIGGFIALLIVTELRIPHLYAGLRETMPPDLAKRIGDEAMVTLSLKVGAFLAALVLPFFYGALLAIAATLEKRLFPVALELPFGQRSGLYFAVVVLTILPVQAFALLSGATGAPRHAGVYLFIGAVLAGLWWLFRRGLRTVGVGRSVVVVALSAGLAVFPLVG